MQHFGEISTAQRSRGEHHRDKCCVKARKGFSNRRFERRFWVLLPPRAKVPRAGARNVPLDNPASLCTREALEFRACGRGGAMHPKGTCSASLHCVGIAPYGRFIEVRSYNVSPSVNAPR